MKRIFIPLFFLILSMGFIWSLKVHAGGEILALTLGGEDFDDHWAAKMAWYSSIEGQLDIPYEALDHYYQFHSTNLPPLGCASFFDLSCHCSPDSGMPYFNGGYAYVGGSCAGGGPTS